MATTDQITQLRRMIGELEDTAPWTDPDVERLVDGSASLNEAAMKGWQEKAAMYASMVDTTESGSSRRLSQLQDQALKMAKHYEGLMGSTDEAGVSLEGYSYVVAIERR